LSNNDKNFIVSDIVTSDLNNRDQKLNLQYTANILNKVSTFDNEMYVDLDYDKEYSSLDFKERKKILNLILNNIVILKLTFKFLKITKFLNYHKT